MQPKRREPREISQFKVYYDAVKTAGGDLHDRGATRQLIRDFRTFGFIDQISFCPFLGVLCPTNVLPLGPKMLDAHGVGNTTLVNWALADYVPAWNGSKAGLGNATNTTKYCNTLIPQNRVMLDGANSGFFGVGVSGGPVPTGNEFDCGARDTSSAYASQLSAQLFANPSYARQAGFGLTSLDSFSAYVATAVEPSFLGNHFAYRSTTKSLLAKNTQTPTESSTGIGSGAWTARPFFTHNRSLNGSPGVAEYSKKTLTYAIFGLNGWFPTDAQRLTLHNILRDWQIAHGIPASTFA